MALFRLASIVITDPVDVAFSANDLLIVFWNSSTEAITVELNGSPFTTAGTTLGSLNTNYRIVIGVSSTEGEYAVAGYSFCDSTDLVWFRMLNAYPEYPFFEQMSTVDSPVCDTGGGVVCDIHFVGPPQIVHATNQTDGGSITAVAVSSNGTVRYGLRNEAYADMTNTSGTLPVFAAGNWTLYAKDPNDCTAIINFRILFKPTEAEHYRFTWTSLRIGPNGVSRDARVRIYEREYVGDLVEVNAAAASPFNLTKPKQGDLNNKLFPVHPTNALLSLTSEFDFQFLPLFTEDNKKYKCVYEVDEDQNGSFVADWSGFFEPNIYREDFESAPYYTEFQIVDNVKILEKEPFTDDSNNLLNGSLKLIKVIALIMKKTGLSLKIRSGINIFEVNHDTDPEDDPLDQTYIDVACYREGAEPFNCWQVLEAILKPFGARIIQSQNQWLLEEIDRAHEGYAYRIFTTDGVYESNSTIDPTLDIRPPAETDRVALKEQDHSLEIIPAYGKITLTSTLNYIGSIVAGGFEKEDLLSPESEVFSLAQGVYTSEEGFRDWTLRLNGTSGVSFGRARVSDRGEDNLIRSRQGVQITEDSRSVGAFYFFPESWGGNLRDAYIESAVKPYQYGPGDELKLFFEYSTPARPEYEFMVLRVMIKIGSNYLQPDLTWDSVETIYRSYPKISNSLEEFELSVPVPDTDVVVDSTIQVRIYFYAATFFDYGLPASTSDPDGTDGISGLEALVTDGVNYDYRLDVRREFTLGVFDAFYRDFYELRVIDAAEDFSIAAIAVGIIRLPTDYDASTNPKVWYRLKEINIKDEQAAIRRVGDRKFFVDNISLDALINGQPPPEEQVISLQISKYLTENLEVELYNFDLPAITNGKNMYNNYFRLEDGTPTALWARSGVPESLSLQHILLKVLGGNHSAPTFRLTGSFVNEFSRIGFHNYLRLVKAGSDLTINNTDFVSDLSDWLQTGTGTSFTWTADNSGSAEVTLTGAVNSKKIYQQITHEGGYINIQGQVNVVPTGSSDREDNLWVLFFRGTSIVHTERLKTFHSITSESSYSLNHTAFVPGSITGIGFFFQHVQGSGESKYQVSEFAPDGTDITEVYQIADYQFDEKNNSYFFELMQLSKTYISLQGIDTGGTNQSGSAVGRAHSSAHSSAFS